MGVVVEAVAPAPSTSTTLRTGGAPAPAGAGTATPAATARAPPPMRRAHRASCTSRRWSSSRYSALADSPPKGRRARTRPACAAAPKWNAVRTATRRCTPAATTRAALSSSSTVDASTVSTHRSSTRPAAARPPKTIILSDVEPSAAAAVGSAHPRAPRARSAPRRRTRASSTATAGSRRPSPSRLERLVEPPHLHRRPLGLGGLTASAASAARRPLPPSPSRPPPRPPSSRPPSSRRPRRRRPRPSAGHPEAAEGEHPRRPRARRLEGDGGVLVAAARRREAAHDDGLPLERPLGGRREQLDVGEVAALVREPAEDDEAVARRHHRVAAPRARRPPRRLRLEPPARRAAHVHVGVLVLGVAPADEEEVAVAVDRARRLARRWLVRAARVVDLRPRRLRRRRRRLEPLRSRRRRPRRDVPQVVSALDVPAGTDASLPILR